MAYRSILTLLLCLCSALALADYAAAPKRPVDWTGHWILDEANSDDPEAMLAERQAREREKFERWRSRVEQSRPPGMPPPIDAEAPPPDPERRRALRPWQKRRQENLLRMLAVSPTLEIKQIAPTRFEITSAVESRQLEAGSHTQVSMPEGQLADSRVGWDGEWFVIDRRVRRGPRALEKFRIVRKTGQLEYYMAWSGDGELVGMKVRRYYDRRTEAPPERDPDSGPNP